MWSVLSVTLAESYHRGVIISGFLGVLSDIDRVATAVMGRYSESAPPYWKQAAYRVNIGVNIRA